MATQWIDVVNGSDTLATVSITDATKANPCVITSNAHGFGNGQWIRITGVAGMTQLNNNVYKTANVATNTFELQDLNGTDINSSAYGIYTSGGTVTQWRKIPIAGITQANPGVITAYKHGFTNGQKIIVEDVVGMTEVNDKVFTVANKTTDTFELSGVDSSGFTAWSSGGTVTLPFAGMTSLETHRGTDVSPQNSFWKNGDSVKFAKTFNYADITTGSGDIVFTKASTNVTTSADLRASLAVGDFIGLTTARLDGCASDPTVTKPDIFYRIDSITASAITINSRYGGATTTVSTVNRLRVNTEIRPVGAVSGDAITTAGINVIYEGGYDLTTTNTTIARDSSIGATALRTNHSGDNYVWLMNDNGGILRYINAVSASRGINITPSSVNATVEYCSCLPILYYPFLIGGTNPTVNYCSALGNITNYYTFHPTTTTIKATLNYCYGAGSKSSGIFNCKGVPYFFNNCYADQHTGFNLSIQSSICTGCVAYGASYGFLLTNSTQIINCTADACVYGGQTVGQTTSQYIYGCTFQNCTTYGIYAYRLDGLFIENCTFSGNAIDIFYDQYSRDSYVINCTSTTPTLYMFSRDLQGGIIHVYGCSIDAPSISKAFQVVAGVRYTVPEYHFQNSFGLTGQYWAYGYLVEDTSSYRTSSPSLKLAYNSTVALMNRSMKIASTYVTGGVAKTVTYYIKRDAGAWSGTITPQLRLNGKLIKTGTDITSLDNDWNTQQTISATAGEISEDGELSLEFIYNANNVAIWIDDVVVS